MALALATAQALYFLAPLLASTILSAVVLRFDLFRALRRPIDDFFDHVTVNDPDATKRERRLNLLMRFRDAVNRVADFSKIEG